MEKGKLKVKLNEDMWRKKISELPKSPFQYTLAILMKKGAFCPMAGKPFKMKITIKNIGKKAFAGSVLEYVFISPTPFAMEYSWTKLDIPQLKEDEEISEEIFYYPPTSGQREIRFRTTDSNVGLCIIKGKVPMVGNELRESFRVYSWREILQLGGALSAIIGAMVSIIILLLSVLGLI